MAEYTEGEIRKLRERWAGKGDVIDEVIRILKGDGPTNKLEENRRRLREASKLLRSRITDYEEIIIKIDDVIYFTLDLRFADLKDKDFQNTHIREALFDGAELFRSVFDNSDLEFACFNEANIMETSFINANLRGAHLWIKYASYATFHKAILSGAHFENADLKLVNFKGSDLKKAHFENADLNKADFEGADLDGANLIGADLTNTNFRNANLSNVKWHDGYKKFGGFPTMIMKCPPLSVEGTTIIGASFANCRRFERYIKDEQFIQELEENAEKNWLLKVLMWGWKATSDYGRSVLRWGLVSLAMAFFWGILYILAGRESFIIENNVWNLFAPFYYSIVTFTTLGFGDITPKVWWLQVIVTCEVIMGYVMLGGLISIFANKLARRAG